MSKKNDSNDVIDLTKNEQFLKNRLSPIDQKYNYFEVYLNVFLMKFKKTFLIYFRKDIQIKAKNFGRAKLKYLTDFNESEKYFCKVKGENKRNLFSLLDRNCLNLFSHFLMGGGKYDSKEFENKNLTSIERTLYKNVLEKLTMSLPEFIFEKVSLLECEQEFELDKDYNSEYFLIHFEIELENRKAEFSLGLSKNFENDFEKNLFKNAE